MQPKTTLREPLLHFLILGALLFGFARWRGGGGGPGATRIVVTSGRVAHLAAVFERMTQRPPNDQELQGLVENYVREEVAVRAATAQGMDRDDPMIRATLREKLEFQAQEAGESMTPTEAELQDWLTTHPKEYLLEAQVSFRQVFVDAARGEDAAQARAKEILTDLAASGANPPARDQGDPLPLPGEYALSPRSAVAQLFGVPFADQLLTAETGRWTGPIVSPYGLHLVLVRERVGERLPPLNDVRPAVEAEWREDQRRLRVEALYRRLLARTKVVVEPHPAASKTTTSSEKR